jgi:methylthioribose-1-phosphate isomerase
MPLKVDGTHYRSLWWNAEAEVLEIIDQRWLPHDFRTQQVVSMQDFADAIREMRVRGAPLIGATAAYGIALAMKLDASDRHLDEASDFLNATRPTAVNLRWAINRAQALLQPLPVDERAAAALALAHEVADEDVEINRNIGLHGLAPIEQIAKGKKPGETVNILTHCNAGWLATVDQGTATSPIYTAFDNGLNIHVWVDETRPRNQGALTSWELKSHGVPHTYVIDNAGGHLMQHGKVDIVIVGTDRTSRGGDVCNKIGTYHKALAAHDNNIPFYVALPSPTIDWTVVDGVADIPIEERPATEVSHIQGATNDGAIERVQVSPAGVTTANPAFDVTPNRLVTGLITERGISEASEQALCEMFPDLC